MKIILERGQNLFFTSDTHFGHKNICRGVSEWTNLDRTRDFSSVEKMNAKLVDNINRLVKPDDILIHLGDWSFGGRENIEIFRHRIMCQTIHLVLGNHDEHIRNNWENCQDLFASVHEILRLSIVKPNGDKSNFFLCHFPVASWDNMQKSVMHLHGHVHLDKTLRVSNGKAMDVGVDGNELEPIGLDSVIQLLKNQPIDTLRLRFDHHVN